MSIITQHDNGGFTVTLPIDHPLTGRIKKLILAYDTSEQLKALEQPRLSTTLKLLLNSVDLLLLTELNKLLSISEVDKARQIETLANAINAYGEL